MRKHKGNTRKHKGKTQGDRSIETQETQGDRSIVLVKKDGANLHRLFYIVFRRA